MDPFFKLELLYHLKSEKTKGTFIYDNVLTLPDQDV